MTFAASLFKLLSDASTSNRSVPLTTFHEQPGASVPLMCAVRSPEPLDQEPAVVVAYPLPSIQGVHGDIAAELRDILHL